MTNKKERLVLTNWSRGHINIDYCPCPVPDCTYQAEKLRRHFNLHVHASPLLSGQETVRRTLIHLAQGREARTLLRELQQTEPRGSLRLDNRLLEALEQQNSPDEDEDAGPSSRFCPTCHRFTAEADKQRKRAERYSQALKQVFSNREEENEEHQEEVCLSVWLHYCLTVFSILPDGDSQGPWPLPAVSCTTAKPHSEVVDLLFFNS